MYCSHHFLVTPFHVRGYRFSIFQHLTISNANHALHHTLPPQQATDDELLKAFGDKNQELVQQATTKSCYVYLTNVKIVAQHRLDLINQTDMTVKQLEQQCSRGTLAQLVEQAEQELERVKEYKRQKSDL